MSEWTRYRLKDITSLSNGINFDKSAYTSGVKLIGVSDFKDRVYPDYDSLQEVDQKVVRSGDYLEKGDIVFVRSNGNKELVGRCMMIDRDIPVTFSGFCIKLHLNDKKSFEPVYFNYLFRTRQFKKSMTSTAVGANIQNLSQSRLGSCEVSIPDIDTQKRIAVILSRYDSLIENYQKQIKLLEEAAQRLYKEWFVDLRFPGHENTKIVDGVPEGWEKKPVDCIYSIKYGKNLSTKLISESGEFPVYGANGVIGYYDKANCNEQVVLITSRGNGSGDVLMTYHKDAFITNNSFIVSPLKDYSYCLLPFTYQFLKNANFRAVRTGAAQPQLTNQSIHTVDVMLPSKGVIIDYCDNISYSNKEIITFRNQIRLLTEARDRLLPKLMSGEISVETAQSVTSGLGVRKEQTGSPKPSDS